MEAHRCALGSRLLCPLVFLVPRRDRADALCLPIPWTWSSRVMETQNHIQLECLPGHRQKEIQFTAYWDCCYISLPDLSPVSLCHSLANFFVFQSVWVCERMKEWVSGGLVMAETKSREVHCCEVCVCVYVNVVSLQTKKKTLWQKLQTQPFNLSND